MRLWIPTILCLSIGLGISLRIQNYSVLEGRYFLGTDAYRQVRQAKQIVKQGRLPAHDEMRAVPLGLDNSKQFSLYSYVLAYAFKGLRTINPNLELEQVAILYPVVVFALIAIVCFLLVQQLADTVVALFATIGLSVAPSIIVRTAAGFADRDAFTILLFLLILYLYSHSWNTQILLKQAFYTLLSGITTGMLALTWPGVGLLTTIIAVWNLVYLVTEHFTGRRYLLYCLWYIPAISFMLPFARFYRHLSEPFVWLAIGFPSFLFVLATIYRALEALMVRHRSLLIARLPFGWCLLGVVPLVGGLLIIPFLGPGWLWEKILILRSHFFSPLGRSRIMSSISEMKSSYFLDWWIGFGFFLFAAIAGAGIILDKIARRSSINRWYVLCAYMVMISGIIYSRMFPHNVLSDETVVSNLLYLGGTASFILVMSILHLLSYYQSERERKTAPIVKEYSLLLLIWFLWVLVLARSAIRFGFFFTPIALIMGSYFIAEASRRVIPSHYYRLLMLLLASTLLCFQFLVCEQDPFSLLLRLAAMLKLRSLSFGRFSFVVNLLIGLITLGLSYYWLLKSDTKLKLRRIGAWTAVAGVVLVMFVGLPGYQGLTTVGFAHTKGARPLVTAEWRHTFDWMRNNTPPDSVIAAWWDYGSWINYLGERATVIDEEQNQYWVHLMARHVLMGQSENEALEFLKTHRVTHLLMSYREIENMPWISWIGSDKEQDRRFSLGTMRRNGTVPASDGKEAKLNFWSPSGIPIDDSVQVKGHFYPRRSAYITHVSVPVKKDGVPGVPRARFVHNNHYLETTISEIYSYGKRWHFPDAELQGCLLLNVGYPTGSRNVELSAIRSATYLPKFARQSLLVKLFLLDEPSNVFQLVYPARDSEAAPIKVWNINYPDNIRTVPDYLRLDAPNPAVLRP